MTRRRAPWRRRRRRRRRRRIDGTVSPQANDAIRSDARRRAAAPGDSPRWRCVRRGWPETDSRAGKLRAPAARRRPGTSHSPPTRCASTRRRDPRRPTRRPTTVRRRGSPGRIDRRRRRRQGVSFRTSKRRKKRRLAGNANATALTSAAAAAGSTFTAVAARAWVVPRAVMPERSTTKDLACPATLRRRKAPPASTRGAGLERAPRRELGHERLGAAERAARAAPRRFYATRGVAPAMTQRVLAPGTPSLAGLRRGSGGSKTRPDVSLIPKRLRGPSRRRRPGPGSPFAEEDASARRASRRRVAVRSTWRSSATVSRRTPG